VSTSRKRFLHPSVARIRTIPNVRDWDARADRHSPGVRSEVPDRGPDQHRRTKTSGRGKEDTGGD
jgi:hypothetical protein